MLGSKRSFSAEIFLYFKIFASPSNQIDCICANSLLLLSETIFEELLDGNLRSVTEDFNLKSIRDRKTLRGCSGI